MLAAWEALVQTATQRKTTALAERKREKQKRLSEATHSLQPSGVATVSHSDRKKVVGCGSDVVRARKR